MVEPEAKSTLPENAHHAINLRLLQIRGSSYLFDLIELLRRGLIEKDSGGAIVALCGRSKSVCFSSNDLESYFAM